MLRDLITSETPVNNPKIKNLLVNEEKYMSEIMTFTDKRLEKMIRVINLQLPMALEQQKMVEVEVLYLFKQMLIHARIRKNEIECETGIYEEDAEKQIVKKRIPKAEKKNQLALTVDRKIQTIEEDNNQQEEMSSLKQLSLFDFGGE